MKRVISVVVFLCVLSKPFFAFSQLKDTLNLVKRNVNKTELAAIITTETGLYVGMMSYPQFIWYKDSKRVDGFEWYNDSKGYFQQDKFGHMYGAYMESYIGYHALLDAGVSRNKALIYGAPLGFVLQLPIEIWDGLYEDWGFSWSDVAANTLGSSLVVGQELLFKEQVIKYKWSFSSSLYAKQANGYLGNGFDEIFYDYNGHTYWFSFGVNRIIPSKRIPDWLNIAFGHSANGMFGEFKNLHSYYGKPIPETERYRQFLLSLDIDWTKIPTHIKYLKKLFNGMFMVKLPFPALEYNMQGKFKFYGMYY